ncbi:YkgJ family cysteine cluster protein [Desulfospira joergensenii]|uniref:YkgJ family cysteine cluster protein n=1 Tax=Desulfospira joergensenii TaxID=53329 RepID=UPI0003B59A7D|nr:YkgJ family cysteine cluster protein [Desulfospira joergensenii]
MNPKSIRALLENYFALVRRVDEHVRNLETRYRENIACKKGCDDCCRFLTLFPVEAFALAAAFAELAREEREAVREACIDEERCPLLLDHQCLLYPARPIICRTHGFPIYMEEKGTPRVDFCPENFKGITDLPKEALMDLDQLNAVLTAVNSHFIQSIEGDLPERIPVSQVLFLLCD